MTTSSTMLSLLLFLHLGSLVIVNGYTIDDPQGLEDVSQDDVLNYLDYLEGVRNANLLSGAGGENIHQEK